MMKMIGIIILFSIICMIGLNNSCLELNSTEVSHHDYDITELDDNCIYITDLDTTIELDDSSMVNYLEPTELGTAVDGEVFECEYYDYDNNTQLNDGESIEFSNNDIYVSCVADCDECPGCNSCCDECVYDETTCSAVCNQDITETIIAPSTFVNFLCGIQLTCEEDCDECSACDSCCAVPPACNSCCAVPPACDSCCPEPPDCELMNVNETITCGDTFEDDDFNVTLTTEFPVTTFECDTFGQTTTINGVTITCNPQPKANIDWVINAGSSKNDAEWDVTCECNTCEAGRQCNEEDCEYYMESCVPVEVDTTPDGFVYPVNCSVVQVYPICLDNSSDMDIDKFSELRNLNDYNLWRNEELDTEVKGTQETLDECQNSLNLCNSKEDDRDDFLTKLFEEYAFVIGGLFVIVIAGYWFVAKKYRADRPTVEVEEK